MVPPSRAFSNSAFSVAKSLTVWTQNTKHKQLGYCYTGTGISSRMILCCTLGPLPLLCLKGEGCLCPIPAVTQAFSWALLQRLVGGMSETRSFLH